MAHLTHPTVSIHSKHSKRFFTENANRFYEQNKATLRKTSLNGRRKPKKQLKISFPFGQGPARQHEPSVNAE
jgi:hypothetical protein